MALKLLPLRGEHAQIRERFLREGQATARLRHPHLVAVHEAGEAPEGPWLAMQLVEGASLDQLLEAGPLPVRRAAQVGRDLSAALGAVHAAGLVHRDPKPGNVLVDEVGELEEAERVISDCQTPEGLPSNAWVKREEWPAARKRLALLEQWPRADAERPGRPGLSPVAAASERGAGPTARLPAWL